MFSLLVNTELCQGHGVCLDEASEHFEFDDGTAKAHSIGDILPESRRDDFVSLAHMCPTGAIVLIEQKTS